MLKSISRLIPYSNNLHLCLGLRYVNTVNPFNNNKHVNEQMQYIQSVVENGVENWYMFKKNIINMPGVINEKNVDGILLKFMVNQKKIDTANTFATYLVNSKQELNLGAINGLLKLYYEMSKDNKLSDTERQFILDVYQSLYDKYKVLEATTCESLLHALCAIDEWRRALKVLDDIHLSTYPSHSAYSVLIATVFKNNKETEAMKLIERSLNSKRPLQDIAFEEWINYIIRKYKDNNLIAKHLEDICLHLSQHYAVVSVSTAEKIRHTYASLGWNAQYTNLIKNSGQCKCCRDKLKCLKLTEEEFQMLQTNVKDKLIVGSDLFLKTSPGELKRFLDFVERTAPYDVVLDALNISYAASGIHGIQKIEFLETVINHFRERNMKNILLLGRKHMLKWSKHNMPQIFNSTCSFFTDDLSQDDPFFITAAILSGSHTDIVSRDLLRGHRFLMKHEHLQLLFKRWQWQHQWMVYNSKNRPYVGVQPPLQFTPCAQKTNDIWHLPYAKEESLNADNIVPDMKSWLCLKP